MSYELSTIGRLFVVRWGETTTSEDVDGIAERVLERRAALGRNLIYVGLSGPRSRPPTGAAQQAVLRRLGQVLPACDAFYVVLEARGFRGSVVRSAIATMMRLTPLRGIRVVDGLDVVLERERWNLGVDEDAARRRLVLDGLVGVERV